MLETAPDQLPFRFAVYAFDGSDEHLKLVTSKMRDGAQLVGVTPPANLAKLTRLLDDPRCNHVLTADEAGFATVAITVQKFVTGDLFGIEKYLPRDAAVHLTRLREYKGRTAAIDEVLAYAEKVGVRRQVRSSIGQVCEELLMNALYDAPADENGNPIFAEVDLKERLDKLSPRPVSIRYAATENGFAVSVRDRFGRLDKATVLRYIDKCLHSSQQIDRKTYGAGLGIYLIANAATQFVLNVAPGMATEVVCTFDRKNARSSLRALSVFVYPGAAQQVLQQSQAG
jgi:anti-sigma regulatory factor (Ser/Thr protein kinase)